MPDEYEVEAPPPDETIEIHEDRPVACERIIGAAGTGKTYNLIKRVGEDPRWGLLSSTTGISAVNIGAITVHSTLKYSDTASLRDAFLTGRLARTLHGIALEYRNLVVEEYSMSDASQLDLWYRGVQEANRYRDVHEPLGLVLVGDLAQLSPVNGRWCFYADCWGEFASHTTRLEKVWRQDGGPFLDALNLMRIGNGGAAAEVLTSAGARWETQLDSEFDGTSIVDENKKVNRFNTLALDRVQGTRFTLTSRRWGKQRSEWGQNVKTKEWGIPPSSEYKIGAYVMCLANAADFSIVNGDCGYVREIETGDHDEVTAVNVEMVRNGKSVWINPLVRGVEYREAPDGFDGERIPAAIDDNDYIDHPHYRGRVRRYVVGQIEYIPIRLAYCTTVHKSQSLTLDRVQVDYRGWMFGKAAMAYVALSRCRSLAGLRLVGSRETFAKQVAVDPRVTPWL